MQPARSEPTATNSSGPPPGVANLPAASTGQPEAPPPGAVLHGTCGWSDASLVRCGRFYPTGVRSTEDKLKHYSRHFACVEVDTSTYAIPRAQVTRRWAQCTSPGFKFHPKAFGLFCSQSCQVSALPQEARALLPPSLQQQQHVRLGAMPAAVEDCCWALFHEALEPLYQASKLGAVVFQFHLNFLPCQNNLEYILRCRARLDARYAMAAEVRCRRWFTEPAWQRQLCEALSAQGISLVSADELAHETAQRDREQVGLPPGEVRQVLPIALQATTPEYHYVRVHRRHGTTDRLLPAEEIEAWAQRLAGQLAPHLQGPIYFLWGTDWEDVPMRNARSLDAALPTALRFDWKQQCRAVAKPGSLQSFLRQRQAMALPAAAPDSQAAEQAGACDSGCGGRSSTHRAPDKLVSRQAAEAPELQKKIPGQAASGQKRGRDERSATAGSSGSGSGSSNKGAGSILRFLKRPAEPG